MKFDCPHCNQKIEVDVDWAGHSIECPSCGHALIIPEACVADVAMESKQVPEARPSQAPRRTEVVRPSLLRPSGSKPVTKRPRGGFGKFVLFILLLAAGGFGFAMYHFHEGPSQTWERLVATFEFSARPAPTPFPTPDETQKLPVAPESLAKETPEPSATPTPPPKPEATPAPTPDALAYLINNPKALPSEVTLLVATDFDIVINGRHSGNIKANPGTRLAVQGIKPGYLKVSLDASSKWLPVTFTDLADLAPRAMQISLNRLANQGALQTASGALDDPTTSRASSNGMLRRPISPNQPMWLIHIDTWNYPDPQKIIDLVPEDIRPFVVMNISLSISRDPETGEWKLVEYGYETAKSWLRTCAENRMWAMIQPSSGGFSHFSDFDLSVYEEFYRDYPNFIGFNYCEQFWGFGEKYSVTWAQRFAHFTNLMKLNQKYGGYLVVSWCGAYYGASINPIAMMKRNPDFAAICRRIPQNFILCEKFTSTYGYFDNESTCLGTYLSGLSGHYGIRYDDTGWTGVDGKRGDDPEHKFPVAAASAPLLEHAMLTGQTVMDGPELIWAQSILGLSDGKTDDGYQTRRWQFYPQLENITLDIFRKMVDGTVRIPTRKEVIDRTKVVIVNDVKSGDDRDIYSAPISLFEGLYRMDSDGNMLDNHSYFKKTGRYPAIPTVFELSDAEAHSFEIKINKSAYEKRWPTLAAKVNEMNGLFPQVSTGDLYVGRSANGLVTYNPYKTNQTAHASIPLKYNTCNELELSYSQFTACIIKEYANKLTFYLNNFNGDDAGLRTDVIKIYGSSSEPTFSYVDRGKHEASTVTKRWANGVFTLNIAHNGPLDLTVNCSGRGTDRLKSYPTATIVPPVLPAPYTGPRQYEAECFDFKNVAANVINGSGKEMRDYTGQGYMQFGDGASASVRHTVTALKAGRYTLKTKYAAKGANIDTVELYVNGVKVATPIFTKTSLHGGWSINKQNISLKAGENTVEFRANGKAASRLFLDNIVLVPQS
jgi:hypothetical protein